TEMWYTRSFAPVTTVTVHTLKSTYISAQVAEYSNIAALTTSSTNYAASNAITFPTPILNVSDNNSLVIGAMGMYNNAATITDPSSPWTNLTDVAPLNSNGTTLRQTYRVAAAAGNYSASWSASAGRYADDIIAAFKPTTTGTASTIAQVLLSDAKDLVFTSADTTTDSNI